MGPDAVSDHCSIPALLEHAAVLCRLIGHVGPSQERAFRPF